ncbi:hypothetical protein AAA559_33570, partial [Pseudomonas aeruginosa]
MNTWVSFQSAEQPLLGQFSVSGNMLAFSSNYALYGDVSARVVRVLRELAPRLEVYSIDKSML